MKTLTYIFCFLSFTFLYSQENPILNVGDEVEYFDGLNWIDSKIAQVGDKKYLVYLKGGTQTKWFPAEDVNPLYKEKIVETRTVTKEITTIYLKIGDVVSYTDGTRIIESEIVQINSDSQCLIFNDANKSSTIWVPCSNVNLLKSKVPSSNTETKQTVTQSTQQITKTDHPVMVAKFKAGDIVSYTNMDGKTIETEIIQVNSNNQSQVFYDETQTSTIWVSNSELKYIRSKN